MDHAGRRARLAEGLRDRGLDAVLVTRLVNVRYLTGFTGTNGQLLATADGGVFFTDSRYEEQSHRQVEGLRVEVYGKRFAPALAETARSLGAGRIGFESAGVTHKTWRDLEAVVQGELIPTQDMVERLRWVKDPQELALIERAQAATDDAFERVTTKLVEGVTEHEVAFELEAAMRDAGADGVGFPSIVAFGESAAEPHHGPGSRPLSRGDVVKLDFGCVVGGYHSDMTRTVAFGEPDPRLREVYELVRAAQEAGIAAARAGRAAGEADAASRAVIRDAGYAERFGHSLGHGIGLEVHEGPTLRDGSTDVLPGGTIVTVEPGVYLPGLGGVRIEDMVVVEDHAARPLPRSTKELLVL